MNIKIKAEVGILTLAVLAITAIPQMHARVNTVVNFDVRKQTLERRIVQGLADGQLTDDEAIKLSKRLKEIVNLQAMSLTGAGYLNEPMEAKIQADLDKLSADIDLESRQRTTANQSASDIETRTTILKSEIDKGVAAGRLSETQALQFEHELKCISLDELYDLKTKGGLTYWQRAKLNADLDLIASRLEDKLRIFSSNHAPINQ